MHKPGYYRKNRFYFFLIAPSVAIMAWLTLYPVLRVVILSLFDYNYITDIKLFTGLKNFRDLLGSSLFQDSFFNTLVFSLIATVAEVLFGLLLAFAFDGHFPGKKPFMTIAIFPMMLSTMVVSAIWKTLYHNDIGLLNYLLRSIGLSPVGWLIDPSRALYSIILIDIWQWTPFAFILLQASMQSIPREIFEAAQIDGARYFQISFRITLPIIASQILLVAMLRTIDTFKLFGKVYALTQGGPGNSTETLSTFIYREGFSYFNLGRACAASLLTLFVVALISLVYIKKILGEEGINA
ncbi:sugar ABC transporter permease [uncultured Sphaerochaeta sp.]|uniref:carbohydrate ABC transporter permease n=1 Tax=uncultured Sphaerochaeta sp. TaxID=886478 RepID=UPI002A0A6C7A|nr:sugar ABC transporter permease [uncultured Sphaerochaeta sp.]